MRPVGLVRRAVRQRIEEGELPAGGVDSRRGMPVADPWHCLLEGCELVEVRREEAEALRAFHEVLCDSPGDAEPVCGRGAAAQFVHDDESPLRGSIQDASGLQHLRHEGRDAPELHVGRADAAHDRIEDWQCGAPAWHEATNLVQQDGQSDGPDVSALTAHVGACDEMEARRIPLHPQVVGDEARVRICYNKNMGCAIDLERLAFRVHAGSHETARSSQYNTCKCSQDIQCAQCLCQTLNHRGVCGGNAESLIDQLGRVLVIGCCRLGKLLVQLLEFGSGEDAFLLLDRQNLQLGLSLEVLHGRLVLFGDTQSLDISILSEGHRLFVVPRW
mmetsp:Transcript_102691/g.257429  ORF Transcript_102691/g.257429 Transcript_102691/m.257429 type:complete len:331 (+) Transcript_102691:323-1315(+)